MFLGPKRDDYPHHPHDPPAGMWLPVAVLVVPVVLIGMAPWLVEPAGRRRRRVPWSAAPLPDYHLALWHGVTPAVFMTVVALAGGLLLLAAYRPVRRGAAGAAAARGQGDLRSA